jgi:predicted TIM-barrel fold metal-dependent hydrolase
MDRAGVECAVLVQPSVYGWNNDYLCDCLERWPSRFVGVCLVDPRAGDAGERLEYWTLQRGCRGLRINLIGEVNPQWILARDRAEIWQTVRRLGISVSLQMRPEHAPILGKLAAAHPDITFIADYLGPAAFHDGNGAAAIAQFAPFGNILYKILSLGPDSKRPYPYDDLTPLYASAVLHLGLDRLLFGTDFPHVWKACSYMEGVRWLGTLPFLNQTGRRAVGDINARKLWNIAA